MRLFLKSAVRLTQRGLVRVRGVDARSFLNEIFSRDVNPVAQSLTYAMMVSSRSGKLMMESFIYNLGEDAESGGSNYVVESTSLTMADVIQMLLVLRLRHRIAIERVEPKSLSVYFTSEEPPPSPSDETGDSPPYYVFPDPRVPSFGYRVLAAPEEVEIGDEGRGIDYLNRRLEWGIAEGYKETGKDLPLFMNGDIMNGIDVEKDGYPGANFIRDFGIIKRRVMPFRVVDEGKRIELNKGCLLVDEEGKDQGKVLRAHGQLGVASTRLQAYKQQHNEGSQLMVWSAWKHQVEARIEVYKPTWWPEKVPSAYHYHPNEKDDPSGREGLFVSHCRLAG